jgi:serine/threonine protein kinase
MGEVYRAHDRRLGCDVAIKVLPRAFTSDPDRLARFEREARVLASLNHPHIAAIHGVEDGHGHAALVLELVEGETLAERLVRGRIPLKQALGWARQIADGLDAAHEKGIVHRDLKPANIKITPQGVVKVLDFGLARTVAPGDAHSPAITVEGAAIVGTAAYMSPEQARGQAVDKRTDVWAFGCVLYELVTGRTAFLRPTTWTPKAAAAWSARSAGSPDRVAGGTRLPRRLGLCMLAIRLYTMTTGVQISAARGSGSPSGSPGGEAALDSSRPRSAPPQQRTDQSIRHRLGRQLQRLLSRNLARQIHSDFCLSIDGDDGVRGAIHGPDFDTAGG